MTEQTIPAYEDDEISLLDILVTLAESWKLLVFGPLIAGLLAGGLSFLWPKTFESVAIVRMTEEEVALLHAAPVLDPLIEKFGLLANADGIVDDARQDLKKRLTFAVDKKTKLATVTVKGGSPESAQALGQATMDILLIELQPKGKDKEAIEKEIAINNQLIADGIYLVDRQSGKQSNTNNVKGQIANLKLNNLELNLKLQPKGKEVFAQHPSLPLRNSSPKKGLIVLMTILSSALLMLLFVFISNAWTSTLKNEKSASKLACIKKSLGVGRSNTSSA
jgi:uncharacterized protein involved in exopolysaccharide biosynthesis